MYFVDISIWDPIRWIISRFILQLEFAKLCGFAYMQSCVLQVSSIFLVHFKWVQFIYLVKLIEANIFFWLFSVRAFWNRWNRAPLVRFVKSHIGVEVRDPWFFFFSFIDLMSWTWSVCVKYHNVLGNMLALWLIRDSTIKWECEKLDMV